MNIVVNATPLITLARIDRLDLLSVLFDDVIMPKQVFGEIVVPGASKPGADLLAQATWLHVMPTPAMSAVDPLLTGLDAGEVAVLLLALKINPDWVAIDERQARRVAFAMGLPVKGTLGILLAAAMAGLLTEQEVLTDLQRLLSVGIRISPRWQQWLQAELKRIV